MKVSIVMPVYNTEKYLGECLESFIHQTEQDIEIICIDDASTDGSLEILKEYAERNERIKYITVPHAGAGAARNKGIDIAEGDYIYFFDSDDIACENLLSSALTRAEETDADIVVFHGYTFQNDDLNDKENKNGFNINTIKRSGLFDDVFSWRDFPNNIMSIINVVPWNKLYRTEFVKSLPFRFDEISSTNDIAFSALSAAAAERIAVVSDRLTYYRINRNDSITSTKKKNLKNIKYAVSSVVNSATTFSYYDEIKTAVMKFVVGNYCFAFENYCTDLTQKDSAEFYTYIHDLFNSDDFALLKAQDIDMFESNYIFRMFKSIQKYTTAEMTEITGREVIVSLTTIPSRVNTVHHVIEDMLNQTKRADRILLWLARDEFPDGKDGLPEVLLKHEAEGNIEIHFCENLYAHKKYYYSMLENPDSIIITVDDDLIYAKTMIEDLWRMYLCYPHCISTMRCHVITVDCVHKHIAPYDEWVKECKTDDAPSLQAFSTNGAGALYPPHLINEHVFDKDKFLEICRTADDIWLNAMCIANNIRTVSMNAKPGLKYIDETQDERLFDINVKEHQNDVQFQNVCEWLKELYGHDVIYDNICSVDEKDFLNNPRIVKLVQKKYNAKLHETRETIRRRDERVASLLDTNANLRSTNLELRHTIKDLKKRNKTLRVKNDVLRKRIKDLKIKLKQSRTIHGSIKNIIKRLTKKFKRKHRKKAEVKPSIIQEPEVPFIPTDMVSG